MQQDYILRMIEQLGAFVSSLIHKRNAGDRPAALDMLEDAYGRFTGLSPTLVHAISEDDLIQLLRARGGLDLDRGWALAELLREEGLTHEQFGRAGEALPHFVKSLRLYLEVLEAAEDLPALVNVGGLEDVIDRVADVDLAPATRSELVDYLTRTGRLDRAENVIVWSLEWPDPDGDRHRRAIAFYEGLLERDDTALIAGGLPREEVREGLGRVLLTGPDQR